MSRARSRRRAEDTAASAVDHDRSKIVVLSTCDDSPLDVLRCGEALSAVLLECTDGRAWPPAR